MGFSKFVIQVDNGDKTILYDTYKKALVLIDSQYIENGNLKDNFPEEYFSALEQMGFFISNDEADNIIEQALAKDRKLIISVEVALGCNMRCPYCYQGADKKVKQSLSDNSIDDLVKYCELTAKKHEFDEVVLKVLGGEPTIAWKTVKKVINGVSDFCVVHNKKFRLMIDTNGVLIDDILSLKCYDSLLITVPLTYKECHDKMRKLVNGKGSYDTIVANLNRIHRSSSEITMVLRHNTDIENIKFFEAYVKNLRESLEFNPIIDLSYTTEIGEGLYKNELKYEDFIHWKSGEAIDILAANDCNITVTPLMSADRCQHRSEFSLKLFSDGTVGSCAMWFFEKNRIKLSDVCEDPERLKEIKKNEESLYQKCRTCRSFFLCGAGYNLPCIKSLGLENCCMDGAYNLDVKLFLKKYVQYKKVGKDSLFVGFNNSKAIR